MSLWIAAAPTVEAQPAGAVFYTVTPCRLVDTRLSSPLQSGTVRPVTAVGHCGIPSGAAALAVNLTAVQPTGEGHLTLYSGATVPPTSTMNFQAGQVRANNAIVTLDALGAFNVIATVVGVGTVDVVIDTAGYFVGACDALALQPAGGALPSGNVGVAYSSGVSASGGAGPFTYAVTAGALPTNVNLDANTGALSGTPTVAGTFNFTITATDGSTGCTVSGDYSIEICPVLSITPASPSTPIYQVAYNQTLTGVGGTGPYTFALASGTLPAGLSIVGTALTGTPTNTGLYNFSLTVTDANGCSKTQAFSVTARPNAQADGFVHTVGNTQLVVGTVAPATPAVFVNSATGVLANDNGPGGITAGGAVVGGIGGTVLLNTNGTFTYTPPLNSTGAVSIVYTVTDGNGITNTAIATIFVDPPRVWYVDNATASGTNDGRSNTPFKTMTAVAGALTSGGDVIYVAKGTGNTTGAYTMKPSQNLIGAGATLTVGALSVPGNPANTPTLSGTLTLANGVTVNGIDMSSGVSRAITNFNGATYNTVTGVSVTARTIASTTGTAIDIQGTGNTGTMAFASVSANGGANGIVLQNFTGGSFTVTGSGVTAGSGGTIQNETSRGVSFVNTQNVSLSNMNFTNAATTDGVPCAGAATGNTTGCNAPVHLDGVTGATLDRLVISDSAQQGINGRNVTNFTLSNSTLSGIGNAADEDGIHFYNMLGACAIANTSVTGSFDDNMIIQNDTGTATITVTGGSFSTSTQGSGIVLGARGTTNSTLNVAGVTFDNNFGGGIPMDASDGATMIVDVGNCTITNNNDGIQVSAGQTANAQFDFHSNTINANDFLAITVLKAAFSTVGTLEGAVRSNIVTVPNGNPTDALSFFQAGGGALRVAVTGNTIGYAGAQRAILLQAGQDGNGSLEATITGNVIDIPLDGSLDAVTGILAQNAIIGPGVASSMCADIGGAGALRNTFTHSLGGSVPGGDIRLRQRNDGTVRLPGYGGGATDAAAVAAYLNGRNTVVSASTASVASTGFAGGPACAQPSTP